MKIAFFSKEGESGVTSNMSAISIAAVLAYKIKILTLENHWSQDNLAKFLLYGNDPMAKEGKVQYLEKGFTENMVVHLCDYTKKRRNDAWTIEVIHNSLYYLPQNEYSKDVFDYEFYNNVLPRLKYLDKSYDILFIDTKNYTMNSRVILEEADLVVVNLRQDFRELEAFFYYYSSIVYKSIFLISDYRPNKSCNINKIRSQFNLQKDNIIAISHNMQFQSAIYQGKIMNYMYDHYHCSKGDINFCFMRDIKCAVRKIVTMAKEISQMAEGALECK